MRERLHGVSHHLEQLQAHAATQRQEAAQAAAEAWEAREQAHAAAEAHGPLQAPEDGRDEHPA